MLTVENLSLVRGDKKIFSDLGFSLSIASTLVITGKNGSGKSSLLKIIAGILKATSGKILFNEENIEDFRSDFNSILQFVGHKNFLKGELTVLENLVFWSELKNSEILISAALNFFKLSDLSDVKIKNLTAGGR